MSNHQAEALLESLQMDAMMLSTSELAEALGLDIDALTLKAFGDTGTPEVGREHLFTGFEIWTWDELVDKYTEVLARMHNLDSYVDHPGAVWPVKPLYDLTPGSKPGTASQRFKATQGTYDARS